MNYCFRKTVEVACSIEFRFNTDIKSIFDCFILRFGDIQLDDENELDFLLFWVPRMLRVLFLNILHHHTPPLL